MNNELEKIVELDWEYTETKGELITGSGDFDGSVFCQEDGMYSAYVLDVNGVTLLEIDGIECKRHAKLIVEMAIRILNRESRW